MVNAKNHRKHNSDRKSSETAIPAPCRVCEDPGAVSLSIADIERHREHLGRPSPSHELAKATIPDDPPLPPMLRPHCGIWAEPGRVEIMFRLDHESQSYSHLVVEVPPKGSLPAVRGQGSDSISIFVTVTEVAQLCGYTAKTFYNWIETGKLRPEHGLRRFGRDCRIEWKAFKACVDRGEFADVRKVK